MKAGRKLALLMAVTAVTMGIPVVANAQATADYTVQLGFNVPKGFSSRVAAPIDHGTPTINVAMNDVVDLVGSEYLVLPEGTGPLEWHSENTQELDAPFGMIASDPDADLEEPFPSEAAYKFNIEGIDTQTDPSCGATADAPCEVDGSTLFNGGDRTPSDGHWYVQITAQPGDSLWVTTPFADSHLASLKINVVATGVDTQAFIDSAAAAIKAEEKDEAAAINAKLSKGSTKHKVGGKTVWDAYAGYDTETISLFAFYPKKLIIKKGDKVRWHFSSLHLEQHGLAFPLSSAKDIVSNGAIPVCDPDGDSGQGPDEFTVDFETFTCASGTLELDLTQALLEESGDGKYPGGAKKVENSGLRGRNIPTAPGMTGGSDPWDLVFTKTTDS
ncbi:MAG: hypothetical protein QOG04_1130 [Actinomycetota bacterium]|nr:hypothetical protein [Actinomycetota bacterium]